MIGILDQTGATVRLLKRPDRIVSVVPSQTELLSTLGLDDRICGITKFCIHPEHIFRTKTRVGGTKALHIEKIRLLQPDLIIANKEENLQSEIEILQQEFPVYVSDILDLSDSLEMISDIGSITGTEEKAIAIINEIRRNFGKLQNQIENVRPLTCLYFIWKGPWMAAGKGTFIDDMITRTGLTNCIKETRYPELTEAQIKDLKPDVIMLSSEPFPFKEKHCEYFHNLLPAANVVLVDGEMFSWYGSRLLIAPEYLLGLRNSLI